MGNGTTVQAGKRATYPAYKPSGVVWLGDVPEHWDVDRAKWTVTACRNGIWGEEPDGINDLPCVRVADFDRTAFRVRIDDPTIRAVTPNERRGRLLQNGDLLLEKSGGGDLQPVGAVMQYDHDVEAVCANFIARMPVADGYASRFLAYLHAHLNAGRVNTRSIKQTTGIQNIDSHQYLDECVVHPPLDEQKAIAAFLDRETARIDALIQKKRRQIALLQEKRSALISHAVTKGLNPNAPMKDSGIEWLGQIPKHWEILCLKHIARIGNGSTPSRENMEYWTAGSFPWLNSSVVNQVRVMEGSDFVTDRALRECHLPRLAPPTVVVGITGEGKTRGMATVVEIECTINQHLAFITPKDGTAVAAYIRSIFLPLYDFLRRESSGGGSTKGAITCEQLANLKIPCPPIEEQAQIVVRIDREKSQTDTLLTKVERSIDLLREHRTALVSAAATGKIDVREEV